MDCFIKDYLNLVDFQLPPVQENDPMKQVLLHAKPIASAPHPAHRGKSQPQPWLTG
jgi:hypothetical protein